MPPSHPGQPPQWEQHRYPPQGQPYGAQQVSGFLIVYNLLDPKIFHHIIFRIIGVQWHKHK